MINYSPWSSPQWRFHGSRCCHSDTVPWWDRRMDRQMDT